MQLFRNMDDWRRFRATLSPELSLGFAPTMGNLHIGHASLFSASQQDNDKTVTSIFVNPTQFNQGSDFTHYPRTLEDDLELLRKSGVDYCLLPDEQSIYGDGYQYQIVENKNHQLMEGQHRPGHFTGVLTVVMKLFNLAKPHRAYFGEKDFQQFQLIHDMAAAFFLDIEVKSCPTIRVESNLPYSSRNNRLTEEQRLIADQFASIFHQPNRSSEQVIAELMQINVEIEYLEEHQGRRFVAVKIGDIRLIDNYVLSQRDKKEHAK